MQGQISDLRTVQRDLMRARDDMEARVTVLAAQVAKLMEEGQP